MLERDRIIYSIPKRIFYFTGFIQCDVKKSEALEKVALAVKEAIDHGVEKYELLQYIEQLLNIESAGEETMIQVERLTKKFQTHTALNQISVSVQPGSVFGLVGF